jgi:hypothetical protein
MSVPSRSVVRCRKTRFTPEAILLAGCVIGLVTFGPRATAGLFQIPMTQSFGWGREVFSFAIAIQNLLWGVGEPFAGAVADRFGATPRLDGRLAPLRRRARLDGLWLDARAPDPERRCSHRLRSVGLLGSIW